MGGWVDGVCKTSDIPCNCRLTCNNVREEYSDFFIWVHICTSKIYSPPKLELCICVRVNVCKKNKGKIAHKYWSSSDM